MLMKVGKQKDSCTVGETISFWRTIWCYSVKLSAHIAYDPENSMLGYFRKSFTKKQGEEDS